MSAFSILTSFCVFNVSLGMSLQSLGLCCNRIYRPRPSYWNVSFQYFSEEKGADRSSWNIAGQRFCSSGCNLPFTRNIYPCIQKEHKQLFKCAFCKFETESGPILMEHMKEGHLKCEICQFVTENNSESLLADHMKIEHFKCDKCQFKVG